MDYAMALRPGVHSPSGIVKLATLLDGSSFSHLFIPDTPSGFESIEVSAAALANTQRLYIGSGVIRILEHDEKSLLRRIEAIQSLSHNRFILGVGTGASGKRPRTTIESLLARLSYIERYFNNLDRALELAAPLTYIATLKVGIAKIVAGKSTGILLNFCSPEYAKGLIEETGRTDVDYSCYIKVFFSRNLGIARRLLVDEFSKYDKIEQYHKMFELDGIADAILSARNSVSHDPGNIPESLLRVSLVNPSQNELYDHIARFRKAGVTLPCVYPYFSKGEDPSYIAETILKIKNCVSQ